MSNPQPNRQELYQAAVAAERLAWAELRSSPLGDPQLNAKREAWLAAAERVRTLAQALA